MTDIHPPLIDARIILNNIKDTTTRFLVEELGADAEHSEFGFEVSPEWKVITFKLSIRGGTRLEVQDHDPSDVVVSVRRKLVPERESEAALVFLDLIFCLEYPEAPPGDPSYGVLSREKIEEQAQKLADMLVCDLSEPYD